MTWTSLSQRWAGPQEKQILLGSSSSYVQLASFSSFCVLG